MKESIFGSSRGRASALLFATLMLAGCGSSSNNRSTSAPPPVNTDVSLSGVVSDGPVIGGTVYAFDATQTLQVVAALADSEDRSAALDSVDAIATQIRDEADQDEYQLTVPNAPDGEILFSFFESTGATDKGFGDVPPGLESLATVGSPGPSQTVNLSLHTSLITQIVLAQLDPDGDGVPIDAAAIESAGLAAQMSVLDELGRDESGEDMLGGEDPFETEDTQLVHDASSVIGFQLRTISSLTGLSVDAAIAVLAADVADGTVDGLVSADFDIELEDDASAVADLLSLSDGTEYEMFAIGPCSTSAVSLRRACSADVLDDSLESMAFCLDISDDGEREECIAELELEQEEALEECDDVFDARLNVCTTLSDAPHEPAFGTDFAANFVDPRDIGTTVDPNPYYPLVSGNRWVYQGSFLEEGELVTETVTVTVLPRIKRIGGIPCIVVNDIVVSDAGAKEDTNDWLAQDLQGNVWYCGEISRDYELFEGDTPEEFELVAIDGSWKHDRDGAEAGVLIPSAPEVGQTIRQEVFFGEAEDMIRVEAVDATETAPAAGCVGDCLKTLDFTPLEPGVEENKFYAPGIGMIVEVDLETGDRLELIEFSGP